MTVWNRIAQEISKPENLLHWGEDAIHVAFILALAWVITYILRRMLLRLRSYVIASMERRGAASSGEVEKRAATLIAVLNKVTAMVIWILAIISALVVMGFHVEPILAGLGVAGIAVGLGAQTLIKDWLGGMFILIEDQLRIGDVVTINGISGTVEEINLRTTILRSEDGAVNIIANGSITSLANKTREYSYFIFEATISHNSDVQLALDILREEGEAIAEDPAYKALILEPIEIMGIDRLGDRGVTLKARIKTLPAQQGVLGRELLRRVKAKLDAAGVAFPLAPAPAPAAK